MCFSYPRILYVDADTDSCEVAKLLLEQVDGEYDITTLTSAEEAFELISQRSFDLYIFDQPWGGSSGIELCRKVREKDGEAPIVMFSAMSREIDRKKAFMAGANVYLVKANDIDKLANTVERLLSSNEAVYKRAS